MMRHGHEGSPEAEGPDPLVARALASLDPGHADAGYWFRFHRGVMAAASRELARRRMLGDVTICYGCGAQHRGLAVNPEHGPFDLHVAEQVDRMPRPV